LPNGEFIIIDVGPCGSPLVDWLSDRGACKAKAVVLTHNDDDHIGALPALVKLPQAGIDLVYMLADRNIRSDSFRRIMRPVRDAVKQGRFSVRHLTAGQVIWAAADGSANVTVRFPDFIRNVDARSPNETSGILTLELSGRAAVVWPGDAMLRDVVDVVAAGIGKPEVLDGPHHGAPQDFKVQDKETVRRMACIGAKRCYVSVGSWNGYEHPKRKYIKGLTKLGCAVSCSQLTTGCEPGMSGRTQPVLPSHGRLGLRAPRSGVACRGAMRFSWKNGNLSVDDLEAEHRTRVRALVHAPACMRRG
jgi:beta-lactamase superfamily II metal-dependent hydrolase